MQRGYIKSLTSISNSVSCIYLLVLRYTEWVRLSKNESSLPLPDKLIANELYNLEKDPDETENVVGNKKFVKKVEELSHMLWEKVNNRI